MEHNYDINVSNEEDNVINQFLDLDLSVCDDYTRQYIDNKTLYYGYDYTKEIIYNGEIYVVNLRLCDTEEARKIRCLRILHNNIYHYIDFNNNKDIEKRLLYRLPKLIMPIKLDDYSIDYIFKTKRYSDLDLLDDNVYFVKERYHHDWHYRAEYESIRRQLIDYLEKNKDKLDDSEIKILDYYINKFKNNDLVIYEKQFNYYFNEQDNSTLENVFIKR